VRLARYPRRFAAALLKLLSSVFAMILLQGYPRRFAAALLKRVVRRERDDVRVVIRGDSPRPY